MLVFATGNGSGEGLALRGFFCLVGRLGLGDGWLEVKFSKINMLVKMIAIVIKPEGGRYEKH